MATQVHSTLRRIAIALIAGAFGIGLFATGVWAGSTRAGVDDPSTQQARGSYWSYDTRTGLPAGPAGQPDFWNYDPVTGEKTANSSPGVAPETLAPRWGGGR